MEISVYIAATLGIVGACALCVQLLVGAFGTNNILHKTAKVIASAGCGGSLFIALSVFVLLFIASLLGLA